MGDDWVPTRCVVCDQAASRTVLDIPHPPAPGGISRIVECSGCGLRRLDPRPSAAAMSRYYAAAASGYNAYVGRTRSPGAQALWEFLRDGCARPAGMPVLQAALSPLTGRIARWLFDINVFLGGRRGLRVLEVGSGFGDILIYLRSRGCEVLGTDLSEEAAAKGREYGVEVRVGNLADLQLPAESFDAAILCHSLEHLPDPRVELRELARVLRPDGELHVAVPNGRAVRLELDGVEWAHLSHPLHLWYFDAETLVRLVESHGFRPVERPRTTTRHHAVKAWLHDVRRIGPVASTRRFWRFLAEARRRPDGGDVLRLVARLEQGTSGPTSQTGQTSRTARTGPTSQTPP